MHNQNQKNVDIGKPKYYIDNDGNSVYDNGNVISPEGEVIKEAKVDTSTLRPMCKCVRGLRVRPGQRTCNLCNAEYVRAWLKTHPLTPDQLARKRARSLVHSCLKRGKLQRKACEICGEPANVYHDDLAKPLEVRWRCRQHRPAAALDLI